MEQAVWALIALFAATLLGSFFYVGSKIDSINARIDGLGGRLDSRIDALDARFDAMEAKLDRRFDGVDRRLDVLRDKLQSHLNSHDVT